MRAESKSAFASYLDHKGGQRNWNCTSSRWVAGESCWTYDPSTSLQSTMSRGNVTVRAKLTSSETTVRQRCSQMFTCYKITRHRYAQKQRCLWIFCYYFSGMQYTTWDLFIGDLFVFYFSPCRIYVHKSTCFLSTKPITWGLSIIFLSSTELQEEDVSCKICYTRSMWILSIPTERKECIFSGFMKYNITITDFHIFLKAYLRQLAMSESVVII